LQVSWHIHTSMICATLLTYSQLSMGYTISSASWAIKTVKRAANEVKYEVFPLISNCSISSAFIPDDSMLLLLEVLAGLHSSSSEASYRFTGRWMRVYVCVSCCLCVCAVVYWSLVVGPVIFPWCLPLPWSRWPCLPGLASCRHGGVLQWRFTFAPSVRPSVGLAVCVSVVLCPAGCVCVLVLAAIDLAHYYWRRLRLLLPLARLRRPAATVPWASYSNTVLPPGLPYCHGDIRTTVLRQALAKIHQSTVDGSPNFRGTLPV